jgi:hypothetical protein
MYLILMILEFKKINNLVISILIYLRYNFCKILYIIHPKLVKDASIITTHRSEH